MLEKSYTSYSPGVLPLFILKARENKPGKTLESIYVSTNGAYIVKQIYNNGEGDVQLSRLKYLGT